MRRSFTLIALAGLIAQTAFGQSTAEQVGAKMRQGRLISAFFGLDHSLPFGANIQICRGAYRLSGMPVIFDRELDAATLNPSVFKVVTRSGKNGSVHCAVLTPALDDGELRTVLLVGDYGTAKDQPVSVEIVGPLLSRDHATTYRGAQIKAIPLEDGPTLVLAQLIPMSQWKSGVRKSSFGSGNGCPAGTAQVIRVTWAGGVLKPDGTEVGDLERSKYKVVIESPRGGVSEVQPFALGDLGDHDNNHLLCLKQSGRPLRVTFPAGFLVDPNHDRNPDTTVEITRE